MITSKMRNNAHEVNVGRKGHKQADLVMVELCRAAWSGSTRATRADAECNCADCGTACGLRGSRRSTPCDDSPCAGHFSDGTAVASTRCAEAQVGGHVGPCEDPDDMCDDKFMMQPNCTAYAMSEGLPPDTSSLGYCCGMKPRRFEEAIFEEAIFEETIFEETDRGERLYFPDRGERLFFPTGWAPSDEWTDDYCEVDDRTARLAHPGLHRLVRRRRRVAAIISIIMVPHAFR